MNLSDFNLSPQATRKSSPYLDKIERRLANKAQKYWASRRAEQKLLSRSPKYGAGFSAALTQELDLLLESRTLTYPPLLKCLGLEEEMGYKEKRKQLGIPEYLPNYSTEETKLIDHMEKLSLSGRQQEWRWRVGNHAEEYQAKGWYPFFVTLTVDQKKFDGEKLWKEGKALRNYIRRLCNIVTKELGHEKAHKSNTPESEYITYVGHVEHGKSREHHHGHFLIWMREIPESWKKCPNSGIQNPEHRNRRECWPMMTEWGDYHGVDEDNQPIDWRPYSETFLSPCLYFRSIGDTWSKNHNHTNVVDKEGKPIRIGTPRQSGGYITKYLSKDNKEWRHRMKATRNLGKKDLIQTVQQMTDSQVEQLTFRPPTAIMNTSVRKIHSVPLGLIRRLSKQENFYRQYRQKSLELTTLMKQNSDVFTAMLRSVQAGQRPDRMGSQEFYDWLSQLLPDQHGFCEAEFINAHKLLADKFPRNIIRNQHTTLPGA